MSLLPVDEALARILAKVPAPVPETVPLAEANGRVLAVPLLATHNQPPFPASAMDGYAVRAADIVPGERYTIVGTSQAGAGYRGSLGRAEIVRIFTGAPLPDGADAVIMQEQARSEGVQVSFTSAAKPGQSMRKTGHDFAAGQSLLPSGNRLSPFSLALAAAANHSHLQVARRPSIAVLATGDELVAPGTTPGPDQIVASNSYGLIPLFAPHAATVTDLGIADDEGENLNRLLQDAFDSQVDVVVTTGGASVGERDIVQQVLRDLGVELDFWRIRMRPGKPLMFGTRGNTLVFGLPGNPVSAMVTASVFILPALRQWAGDANPLGQWFRLPLAAATPPNGDRRHFMRASITEHAGQTAILPIGETDSAHTTSLALADALIIQPEGDPGQPQGTVVEVISLLTR